MLSPATVERNICSADGASSLEKRSPGGFTDLSARDLDYHLEAILDKIYFVIEQGGLGYGGGDNRHL